MDDEDMDRAFESLRRKANAAMGLELMYMEEELSAPTTTVNGAPLPGSCHPYYLDHKEWLMGWIDGKPGHLSGPIVQIPERRRSRGIFDSSQPDAFSIPNHETMRIEKCWAPAPYVGRPYVYTWRAGVDSRGRFVAGEDVKLQHTMDEWTYVVMWGGDIG